MPLIRLLLSFLVVACGLLFAGLLLAMGILSFLFRRLFGRPAAMPRFRATTTRATPRQTTTTRPRDDVIDVESTPVKE